LYNAGINSKKVTEAFCKAISFFGNEFTLLKESPINDIARYQPILGEAIYRMRKGTVKCTLGFDGIYGKIKLFDDRTITVKKQLSIF